HIAVGDVVEVYSSAIGTVLVIAHVVVVNCLDIDHAGGVGEAYITVNRIFAKTKQRAAQFALGATPARDQVDRAFTCVAHAGQHGDVASGEQAEVGTGVPLNGVVDII